MNITIKSLGALIGIPVVAVGLAGVSAAAIERTDKFQALVERQTAQKEAKSCAELVGRLKAEFPEITDFSGRALKACMKK